MTWEIDVFYWAGWIVITGILAIFGAGLWWIALMLINLINHEMANSLMFKGESRKIAEELFKRHKHEIRAWALEIRKDWGIE